ncbi:MAG TPA: pilus assembly protein PilM [Candidatus Binatia bacterium]|nr:pilus assembly protein PilM [Candidatus Binatia bacterium]
MDGATGGRRAAGTQGMRLARWARVPWSLRRASRVLAVDIGSHSVKLVSVRRDGTGIRLEGAATGEMPAGAMYGHVIRDPSPVADVVRRLVRETGARTRRAVAALPGPAVMMRRITVRPSSDTSLDALVVREAAVLIPDALDHAVLDYQVLGRLGPEPTACVLVVAARRDLVRSFASAVRAAGLEPCALDVDVFALDRLYRAQGSGTCPKASVALVHVGARRADVIVAGSDGPVFAGDVPVDGLARDPASFARGVHRALDLSSSESASGVDAVVLSGGSAAAPGLAAALGWRLGCPVTLAEPFRSVALGPRVDHAVLAHSGPAFAIAMGLALGEHVAR